MNDYYKVNHGVPTTYLDSPHLPLPDWPSCMASAHTAPLACISGTLGKLIGAYLLNCKVRQLGNHIVSIGVPGVFEGVFVAGILAVALTGI